MNRRLFATALTAALAVPATAGAAHAGGRASEESRSRAVLAALTEALDGDRRTARILAPLVEDVAFEWEPPTARLDDLDFIVAYGFGNRPPAGGGDPTKVLFEPGPVNEELADTVARIRARRDIPVYAQWEIARFLESKYRMKNVTSIEPVIAPDGTITYLSTDGVAQQVAEARKNLPGGPGTAGVVGFRDHHKRCVLTTQGRGMKAFAPRGFAMPKTYDPQSGQAWTRRRDLYLVSDMTAQWTMLQRKMIMEAYPNG